jgi:hypothetical protein
MEQVVLITLSVVGLLAVASSFAFAFLRRRDNRFRSVRLAIFAAVVTFVFTTACVVAVTRIFYFSSLGRASSTGIQVVFTSQTYDPRTGLFGLDGSVSGLKPEQQLWIFFRDAQRDHHFLALAPCDILPQNRFSCHKIATGAPRPAESGIKGFIAAAMPEAVAVLRQSNSGSPGTVDLYQLPRGATRISQISVGS